MNPARLPIPPLGREDGDHNRGYAVALVGAHQCHKTAAPFAVPTREFRELAELSARHGATLVVVGFRETDAIPQDLRAIEEIPGVIVAYPRDRLFAPLPERTREAYVKVYLHWAGSPPVLVDMHPNPRAHRLMAEEILERIRQRGGGEAELSAGSS